MRCELAAKGFRDGVKTEDVVLGFLTAAYLRVKLGNMVLSHSMSILRAMEETIEEAEASLGEFLKELEVSRWRLNNFPVNIQDVQYSVSNKLTVT